MIARLIGWLLRRHTHNAEDALRCPMGGFHDPAEFVHRVYAGRDFVETGIGIVCTKCGVEL